MTILPLNIAMKCLGSLPIVTLTWTGSPPYFWSKSTAWNAEAATSSCDAWRPWNDEWWSSLIWSDNTVKVKAVKYACFCKQRTTHLPHVEQVTLPAVNKIGVEDQVAVSPIEVSITPRVHRDKLQILNSPHLDIYKM